MRISLRSLLALLLFSTISVPAAQTAQARLYCISVSIDQCINIYGDTINVSSSGAPDGLRELLPWQGPGSEISFPPTESYISNLILYDSLFDDTYFGSIYLGLPPLSDEDGNRHPDFFEVPRAIVNASSFGSYSAGLYGGSGSVNAFWSRDAGTPGGLCVINLQNWGDFYGTFEILEYTGTISYVPGSNTVSASVDVTQTGNSANRIRGPIQFLKSPLDRFNQITNQPTIWTNASMESVQVTKHLFLRDAAWPTNYAGYIEFDNDGDPGTFYPWAVWVLSIDDSNDVNHNNIPDFSDDPQALPPRRPSLHLARTSTNLVLTISGDTGHVHEVLQASALDTSWLSVTSLNLVADPQKVALPLPTGPTFWRVRTQ